MSRGLRWTKAEYEAYLARCAARDHGVRATEPKRAERVPLERAVQRKAPGGIRFEIVFTVYAVRPLDWDNYEIKQAQDCLIHAGLLDGDDWDVLEGRVRSRKVHTKAEEKTVVEIRLIP